MTIWLPGNKKRLFSLTRFSGTGRQEQQLVNPKIDNVTSKVNKNKVFPGLIRR
jgi:hypothetical protein